jgi:non-specific serine/threonine protein kinase
MLTQGLEASSRLKDRRLLLLVSDAVLGWLAGGEGDAEKPAMLLGAAEVMDETIGTAVGWIAEMRTAEAIAALQARLGRERWEVARRKGRSLSFSQVSDLILLILSEVGASSAGAEESSAERPQHSLLSKREEEVLRLVAEGLTNKEIAQQLIVTENTVKTHVTSLFNKLGVDSRAQAVAVAASEGLLDGSRGMPRGRPTGK